MVKQINTFGANIKTLFAKGYSQSLIARRLKAKRQRVNYQALHPIKTTLTKTKKKETSRIIY